MTCWKFAQTIWNPNPYIEICRSFEVGDEKGRTEVNEFDNLYHHPQFHFPESWGGKKKKTEEENVICLPQGAWHVVNLHKQYEILPPLFKFAGVLKRKWKGQSCTEWISQPIPPPTISFSRVLRWEKEKDRGRKCNLPAAGAWHVVNLHKQYEILPPTFTFAGVLR